MHMQSSCFVSQTHRFFKFSFPSPSSLLFPQQSRTYKYQCVSTRAEHGIGTVKYQCYY